MPFSIIPFLLLIIPIAEITVFIIVGGKIGVFQTLFMIFITAILGTFLLRKQGLSILRKLQEEGRSGNIPGRELVHGSMIVIAGILLLTPGFITDCIGFLLFIPPFRELTWNFLKTRIDIINFGHAGSFSTHHNPNHQNKPFVDLNEDEYSRDSDADSDTRSPWIDHKDKSK